MTTEAFPFGWRYNGSQDQYEHYSGFVITGEEVLRMSNEIERHRAEHKDLLERSSRACVVAFDRAMRAAFGSKP